jgi:hypothetical protein
MVVLAIDGEKATYWVVRNSVAIQEREIKAELASRCIPNRF